MTIEALALLICSANVTFSHGQKLSDAECKRQAEEIQVAATTHNIDERLMVAENVWECDLRVGIARPIWKAVGKKRVQIGVDYCPMGLRIYGPMNRAKWTEAAIYMEAARRMAKWKSWCDRKHKGAHHFIAHYNEGNPVYQFQILAIRRALAGKELRRGEEQFLTDRALEIVRRLTKALRKAA